MAEIQLAAFPIDFEADCLASDSPGDLVYVTGPSVADRLQVAKIDIDDGAKMPVVGIILDKQAATQCRIRVQGEYDSGLLTLSPGDAVFAAANGTPSTTPPVRPVAGSRFIQRLGIALTPTKLVIMPQPLVHEILP